MTQTQCNNIVCAIAIISITYARVLRTQYHLIIQHLTLLEIVICCADCQWSDNKCIEDGKYSTIGQFALVKYIDGQVFCAIHDTECPYCDQVAL